MIESVLFKDQIKNSLRKQEAVIIEEELREVLYRSAVDIAKEICYVRPGTVEFLVLPDNKFYFLEMNTRLQVEHTITELITGIDIVKEQIKIFQGDKLSFKQEDIVFKGYALECRVLAENPTKNFFHPHLEKLLSYFFLRDLIYELILAMKRMII